MGMTRNEIEELYRLHGPSVYRRCLSLLGDEESAGDMMQEIFLKLFEKGGFRGESKVTTWLYRVTTNHCLNRLRRRPPLGVLCPDCDIVPGHDEQLVARQLLTRLARGFDRTNARIAAYHFIDGMPQEQIEQVTGISRRTIGKRLQAIRAAARELGLCDETGE